MCMNTLVAQIDKMFSFMETKNLLRNRTTQSNADNPLKFTIPPFLDSVLDFFPISFPFQSIAQRPPGLSLVPETNYINSRDMVYTYQ